MNYNISLLNYSIITYRSYLSAEKRSVVVSSSSTLDNQTTVPKKLYIKSGSSAGTQAMVKRVHLGKWNKNDNSLFKTHWKFDMKIILCCDNHNDKLVDDIEYKQLKIYKHRRMSYCKITITKAYRKLIIKKRCIE